MYDGGFEDFSVNKKQMNKSDPYIEGDKRIGYANLLINNPNTFELIKKNNITVFHGTNSNALPSILKYGMGSIDTLKNNGVDILTGETWSRVQGKRSFISFTDDIDIASGYASIGTTKTSAFGVVIGLSLENLNKQRTRTIHSDVPEIGIADKVSREDISFIGVPPDKVEFVKKLVNDDKVIVAPIEIGNKFYYKDDFHEIHIDEERAKEIITGRKSLKRMARFKLEEIKNLVTSRSKNGILSIYGKIKDKLSDKIKGISDREDEGRDYE